MSPYQIQIGSGEEDGVFKPDSLARVDHLDADRRLSRVRLFRLQRHPGLRALGSIALTSSLLGSLVFVPAAMNTLKPWRFEEDRLKGEDSS